MKTGTAIGIGVSEIFETNAGGGAGPTPGPKFFIQQDFSAFVQQDGTSLFLENN